MSNADDFIKAKAIYDKMIEALDQIGWNYQEEGNLEILSSFTGNDFDIDYRITIDAERECYRFRSKPFATFPQDKIKEGALATCVANHGLVFGHFDFDIKSGTVRYTLADSYVDCELGVGFFKDIMETALQAADDYNDRFLMLANGLIDLDRFIALE